ncbi:MAG: LamG-like jellyroll fold domain-containing protein [Bacteroidia bacterium]|nr:LamG-like jellyroll fold domain-containing protein [Bacteroidia bacterium]
MNFGFWFRLFALVILFGICFSPKSSFGQGGYTLDFNGSNSYVEIPYDAALNPATFSLEAWVKVEGGAGAYRSVITSRSTSGLTTGYMIYAAADNNWQFWTGDNGAGTWDVLNSGVSVSDTWTHVACTYDGSTQRIYINGVEVASSANSYFANTTMPTRIGTGATESTPDFYFNGKIDEVRIWSDVRSEAEIQAYMNKELTGSESNLVGYYQMSDGSGTTLTDNSADINDGTLYNSPSWKTSAALAGPRMALDFDGSDDYISFDSDVPSYSSTITIEAWIKTSDLQIENEILSWGHSAGANVVEFRTNSGKFEFGIDDNTWGSVASSATVCTGEWVHLAVVKNGTSVVLYVNGTQDGSTTMSKSPTLNNMTIGGMRKNATPQANYYFPGQIDEIRIWSTARTEAEIRAYKDRALDGDESGLVAYYRFDQQADAGNTTLYDMTSSAKHGTLTNMTPASDWVAATSFNTWIGSEDSDWSNAANWSSGSAPASTEDVGIFEWSGSNMPASGNISARNFYVASGAILSHSGNLTLSGDYYNAGSFTTTGNVTFSGSATQTILGTGTSTFGTLTINNTAGVTMEKSLTTSTSLTLTNGTLSIGANTLTINGAISQTSGSLTGGSASNLTFGGSGASTSLPAVTLNNLTLNRANGITLGGAVTVNGVLGLSAGILDLNSQTLSLGTAATTSGSPANSNHVDASSGALRKYYASTGSFAFPVGDGTTYSPITLNFTAGTFSTGYANVNLTAIKHPNNTSACDYLNRYWTVSSSGISSFTCAVSAQYANGDISGSEGTLYGGKYSAGDWTSLGVVTTADNLITGTVSSFSDFTAGEESVFPVEWVYFTAQPKDKKILLDWATAREHNSDFFDVERSVNQNEWITLGQVKAVGNSISLQNYTFPDETPINGVGYYRLRQVDIDGGFHLSSVVAVSFQSDMVSLYPNPVQDKLTIETQGQTPVTARLFDMQGRMVMQQTLNSGNPTLSVHNLPSGIYLIRLHNAKGWTQEMKVVKE